MARKHLTSDFGQPYAAGRESRQGIVYAVALATLPALFGLPGVLASQLAADVVTVAVAAFIYRSSGIA
ncbi:MAG: hypothetical protein IJU00_05435 [Selenomonas sp.]|nr:hypothetical protein [Selenomonas sp.]